MNAQHKDPDTSLSRFYVKAMAGYGIGINGMLTQSTDNNGNVTNTPTKLGNGIYGNAGFGYQYNSNLAAEMDIGYMYGLKSDVFPPSAGNSEKLNGTMWQMIPSVVFSTRLGKFGTYIRTGLIIAMPEIFEDYNYPFTDINGVSHPVEEKITYYNGLAFGLQTALGCTYQLNKKFTLFSEAILNNISYTPQKGEFNSFTIDGAKFTSLITHDTHQNCKLA